MVHFSLLVLQASRPNCKKCSCVLSQVTSHPASAEGHRQKSPQANARGSNQRAKVVLHSRMMASLDRHAVLVWPQVKVLVASCSGVRASARDSSLITLGLGWRTSRWTLAETI